MSKKIVWGLILTCMLLFLATSLSGNSSIVANKHGKANPLAVSDIPVLNYHKVSDYYHALSVSPEEFEQQMAFLHEHGYHTITPDMLLANLKFGTALPEKPIVITFDDGYLDNYTNAYPIMQKYGFTATIFVVTSLVGNDSRFMTWDQVREMKAQGFVFGSHTVNHKPLTKLTDEEIQSELTVSRFQMEKQLGEKPLFFAYPTGAYNKEIREQVARAGYQAAFTIRYGQVGLDSDLFTLERIPVYRNQHTFRSFWLRLTAAPIFERLGLIKF